jgi:hypothetical protein
MRELLSKIAIVVFTSSLLTSCTVFHSGYITNSTALSQANFEYVNNNIQGSESIVYFLGMGGASTHSLVHNAKKNMLQRNPLKANQALTNLTVNMKTDYTFAFLFTVTCTVTADVVEFRVTDSNKVFSEKKISPNVILRDEKEEETILTESTDLDTPINYGLPNTLDSVNPSNKEFPDYIIFDNVKYSIGDDVNYTYSNKGAIIVGFIRDEASRSFFDVKIKLKKNNKIKLTSIYNIDK